MLPLEVLCRDIWNVAARPLVYLFIYVISKEEKNKDCHCYLYFVFLLYSFIVAQTSSL